MAQANEPYHSEYCYSIQIAQNNLKFKVNNPFLASTLLQSPYSQSYGLFTGIGAQINSHMGQSHLVFCLTIPLLGFPGNDLQCGYFQTFHRILCMNDITSTDVYSILLHPIFSGYLNLGSACAGAIDRDSVEGIDIDQFVFIIGTGVFYIRNGFY